MEIILQRLITGMSGTFGVLLKNGAPIMCTLELPWKNNERFVSCVPEGTYKAIKIYSPRFDKELFVLKDVPCRDFIEIHIGNSIKDTEGCILLGTAFNINGYQVANSLIAFNSFMSIMPSDGFTLIIKDFPTLV